VRLVRHPTEPPALDDDLLIEGDNAAVLPLLPAGAFDLVYVDPPFNTGAARRGGRTRAVRDASAPAGFGGHGYRREREDTGPPAPAYADAFDDYAGWLVPRLTAAHALLAPHGSLYVHLDQREVHYVKVALDAALGRERFLSEVVWAYDYGGKPRNRWAPKHDTVLVYVAQPGRHHFDADAIDRVPYLAPKLAGPEKAARGKLPTDVHWQTIVPTNGRERTGYPTQKPEGLLRRFVQASSRPGGWCLDCFAGSGTLGAVASALGRRYVLVDASPEAIAVAARRLSASAR
jgi:site-specific DNA-methyltransferase (adenine-specific)